MRDAKKLALLVVALLTCHDYKDRNDNQYLLEGYPTYLIENYSNTERFLDNQLIMSYVTLSNENLIGTKSFLTAYKDIKWENGSVITVSFNGGDKVIRRIIEETAQEWTQYGNIKFDFGNNGDNKQYRTWSHANSNYSSDIRIGFGELGNFSVLGRNSINGKLCPPNKSSMNFYNLCLDPLMGTKRTILHEFGHALGFHHENQRSKSDCNIDIDKARGFYKKNNWDERQLEFNIKILPRLDGVALSGYDPESIMHYNLPASILIGGKENICFTGKFNFELSDKDKLGMSKAYPK